MTRHDFLAAARLVLELVLAIPGCEAAVAMGTEAPPAMQCQLVMRPHVEGPAAQAAPANEPPRLPALVRPGSIVHPLLDCRLREPVTRPATARGTADAAANADVAAR